jgi:Flp pilus assembly pilin Flp
MRQMVRKLWKDDEGALIATEWVFVATILVLGTIVGLVAVRNAVLTELTDFANAVLALNQSYSFSGVSNCVGSTAGSAFVSGPCTSIPFKNVGATVCTTAQSPCL